MADVNVYAVKLLFLYNQLQCLRVHCIIAFKFYTMLNVVNNNAVSLTSHSCVEFALHQQRKKESTTGCMVNFTGRLPAIICQNL